MDDNKKVSKIPTPKRRSLKTPSKIPKPTKVGLGGSKSEPVSAASIIKSSNLVSFSPGKLDAGFDTPGDMEKEHSSQPGSSTCAYSDYFIEDIIFEDPEEDSL